MDREEICEEAFESLGKIFFLNREKEAGQPLMLL